MTNPVPEKPPKSNKKLPKTIEVADLSKDSQEILKHFGLEAPDLLNKYCCALEDAVIEQATNAAAYRQEVVRLRALLEEHNISH